MFGFARPPFAVVSSFNNPEKIFLSRCLMLGLIAPFVLKRCIKETDLDNDRTLSKAMDSDDRLEFTVTRTMQDTQLVAHLLIGIIKLLGFIAELMIIGLLLLYFGPRH
jgi:hypothetical protein